MTPTTIEEAFDLYATTNEPRERQRALTCLITLKALPKQAEDPRFAHGLYAWQVLISQPNVNDEDRLLAVAELVRAVQVVKSKKKAAQISEAITQAFNWPLPPSRMLKDADERLNVARACATSQVAWLPTYLARSVAEEDTGEKARFEFLSVLVSRTDSLSTAFSLLTESFATLRFDTEAPGDSMAKRLIRTLVALRPVLLASLAEAGEDAGKQFDEWLRVAMYTTGKPKEEKTQVDLTREVALTLHDLVRTRFSMATEPETFAVLKQCRTFFPGISWPAELRKTMDLIVQDVSEALLLLGRQDVPQQALLDQLELVCGLKERAKAVATQLADKHAELPERIRDWLRRGRLVAMHSASDALQVSLLEANDTAVGLALIESYKLVAAEETLLRIIGTIEIYEPTLARPANNYAQLVHDSTAALMEVANRRGISLLGREGDEVEFSPKFFDPLRAISGQRVIVRRPAILRATGLQGGTDVVLKGLVE